MLGSPAPADQPDQEAERAGARGVQQNIDGRPGAAGEKRLVELIATGYDGGGEDGQDRGLDPPGEQRRRAAPPPHQRSWRGPRPGERMQPGAQEREGNRSVAYKMAGLAQKVVEEIPGTVADCAEQVLKDGAQPTAGVLGGEGFRGFDADDRDCDRRRSPYVEPPAPVFMVAGRPWRWPIEENRTHASNLSAAIQPPRH